ncbi:MAG TPA: TolC family protein [Acidobacteriaceae bacterium]|nr:TolC family protein [Acidobacteriaceae bacterium]
MMQQLRSYWLHTAACFLILVLAGCATYHPLPLPAAPDLTNAPELTVPARDFMLPGLKPHIVSSRGLDETTIVMLAVFNDPDLKAARLQSGVASAQVLQAGLLPNPQFSAGYASSARNYGGVLSLSQDIQSLITRGTARAAASATQKQVNLNILWQEWQVAGQASQLFIQCRSDQQLLGVLQANERLLARHYQTDLKAMQRGDETATTVSADLTLLSNVQSSVRQLQSSINLTRHQLNQLLGLQPGVWLHLIGPAQMHTTTPAQFHAAVAALPHRRADLLALQAGYHSQEENLRRTILMQFPALSAGVDLGRDPVEGVNSFGPQVNLTLPIFNHNQGQVAIQRATRTVLRQTYQARLDSAVNQADQVWRANHILAAQLSDIDAELPILRQQAAAAKQSLQQNNLDAGAYVTMQSNYLSRQAEAIRLRASLDSASSAMRILLGLPFGAQ